MKFQADAKSQSEKLPTFLQYLQTIPTENKSRCKVVKRIWFPNKFPNFSFDTESFRLRISLDGVESELFKNSVQGAIENQEVLFIRFNPAEGSLFEIETLEGEVGKWRALGDTGWACDVEEKPPLKKERASSKPVSKDLGAA